MLRSLGKNLMKKKLVIIKLGGSIITNKDINVATPNLKIINSLVLQIKRIHFTEEYNIVLVHGAGSYGHPIVKKYNLQNGLYTDSQKLAFAKAEILLAELTQIITDKLTASKCPAVSIAPHSFLIQKAKKLVDIRTDIVCGFLERSMIPVLFGDIVLDNKIGCSIISGDVIVSSLAKKLKPDKVIFLSDVDGVYEENPKLNKYTKQIQQINEKNVISVIKRLSIFNTNDVTGEMAGKIQAIKSDLKRIHVVITSGLIPNRLMDTVLKRKLVGTELFFAK